MSLAVAGLSAVPPSLYDATSRHLGGLLHRLWRRRRHIAAVNLRLCFPELSETTRAAWVRAQFTSLARGTLETAACWHQPPARLMARLVAIDGVHWLEQARAAGRGAILIAPHFTHFELGGLLLAQCFPGAAVYRPANQPAVAAWMERGRGRLGRLIHKNDGRAMVQALRDNRFLWIAPDQFDGEGVAVRFFGQPTRATAGVARLARLTGAPVLPFCQRREGDGMRLLLHPPLTLAPEAVVAAQQITTALEALIRAQPTDYLWIHRRFKAVDGGVDPYAPARRGTL